MAAPAKKPTRWGLLGALISWNTKEVPAVHDEEPVGSHGTFDAKQLAEAVLLQSGSGSESKSPLKKTTYSYADFAVKMKSPLASDLVRTLRGYAWFTGLVSSLGFETLSSFVSSRVLASKCVCHLLSWCLQVREEACGARVRGH